MGEKTIVVLVILAIFMSLAALCVAFAMLEKLQKVDNQTLENRSSINRHTGRLHKIDETTRRIDRSIDDIYETIGDQEHLIRQFFVEVNQHENPDKT